MSSDSKATSALVIETLVEENLKICKHLIDREQYAQAIEVAIEVKEKIIAAIETSPTSANYLLLAKIDLQLWDLYQRQKDAANAEVMLNNASIAMDNAFRYADRQGYAAVVEVMRGAEDFLTVEHRSNHDFINKQVAFIVQCIENLIDKRRHASRKGDWDNDLDYLFLNESINVCVMLNDLMYMDQTFLNDKTFLANADKIFFAMSRNIPRLKRIKNPDDECINSYWNARANLERMQFFGALHSTNLKSFAEDAKIGYSNVYYHINNNDVDEVHRAFVITDIASIANHCRILADFFNQDLNLYKLALHYLNLVDISTPIINRRLSEIESAINHTISGHHSESDNRWKAYIESAQGLLKFIAEIREKHEENAEKIAKADKEEKERLKLKREELARAMEEEKKRVAAALEEAKKEEEKKAKEREEKAKQEQIRQQQLEEERKRAEAALAQARLEEAKKREELARAMEEEEKKRVAAALEEAKKEEEKKAKEREEKAKQEQIRQQQLEEERKRAEAALAQARAEEAKKREEKAKRDKVIQDTLESVNKIILEAKDSKDDSEDLFAQAKSILDGLTKANTDDPELQDKLFILYGTLNYYKVLTLQKADADPGIIALKADQSIQYFDLVNKQKLSAEQQEMLKKVKEIRSKLNVAEDDWGAVVAESDDKQKPAINT